MDKNSRPPWWTAEDEALANRGEKIVQATEFAHAHSKQLSDLSFAMCQSLRLYLHGDTEAIREQGYADALTAFEAYRDYCYAQGQDGHTHWEDLLESYSIKGRGESAHKSSFAYAVWLLAKII